ncbi:unnamed protein product [Paramecium pentaurelia]|uniref:Uncharacterized protein n=1 Tax=Paramecium pentaurelia TaxID=43138 RepID=A0A8S1VJU9_9CILI|nr:unnamed protein product [Paramecium pentaurelia]
MSTYKYLFKFIIIGDSYVGKSCLVQQFLHDRPRQEHEATVGIEFGVKDINLSGTIIRLSIWDTAGQETFRSLIRAYYRSAIGVFLCYDCSSMQSFNGVEKWVQEVNDNGNENVVIALVCNKIDLQDRQVSSIQGRQFAVDHGFLYAEVSALTGVGVQQIFRDLSLEIIKRIDSAVIVLGKHLQGIVVGEPNLSPTKQIISLELDETQQQKNQKKKTCC